MFDINKITEVGEVPIEKLIAYKPEQCPFRVLVNTSYFIYNKRGVCTLLSQGKDDGCVCINEVWKVGCPLLKDSILVVKG